MKLRLTPLALCLCLLGWVATPAFADDSQSDDSNQSMESISSRTQDLEKHLAEMEKEMRSLKAQLRKSQHAGASANQPTLRNTKKASSEQSARLTSDANNYVPEAQTVLGIGAQSLPLDIDVPGQSFVSTGPYIGVPLSYSGGNLIINSPNINEDVTLLNIRKSVRERLKALGRPIEEDHAHLLLSGIVEGQVLYKAPGGGPDSSDIDVTAAEIDGYILGAGAWTSGLIALAYDNNQGSNTGSLNNNSRSQSSRVFLNKAFIVIGNFNRSPLYGTIGQMYVPFGTYSTNMVSSPLTKILGRTKERALLVGIQQPGKKAGYAAAYVFKGDTFVGSTSRISNGGINLGYRYAYGPVSGDFGGGVLANIADSGGMQNTGNAPAFGGFGGTNGSGNEQISHRVPAMNLRGSFDLGDHINLLAEYIGALNSFSKYDLTMNTHGAKPQALDLEAAYTFNVFEKPSSVAVGYGRSKDSLAIGLPLRRYSLVFNTSLWKDTLQSLEFRHDTEYAASDVATGSGVIALAETGRSDNMVTAQFDLYF